jgi:hypothetical protein
VINNNLNNPFKIFKDKKNTKILSAKTFYGTKGLSYRCWPKGRATYKILILALPADLSLFYSLVKLKLASLKQKCPFRRHYFFAERRSSNPRYVVAIYAFKRAPSAFPTQYLSLFHYDKDTKKNGIKKSKI